MRKTLLLSLLLLTAACGRENKDLTCTNIDTGEVGKFNTIRDVSFTTWGNFQLIELHTERGIVVLTANALKDWRCK